MRSRMPDWRYERNPGCSTDNTYSPAGNPSKWYSPPSFERAAKRAMVAWLQASILAWATGSADGSWMVPRSSALPACAQTGAAKMRSAASKTILTSIHDNVAYRWHGGGGNGWSLTQTEWGQAFGPAAGLLP